MKALLLATVGFLTLQMAIPAIAQNLTRDDVEKIVKDYIQNNPEIILDSVEEYGRQQQQVEMKDRQEAIEKHMGWLENNDMLPVIGNPDGDVTIVEFFDYNCGYCKKALDDVLNLMGEDKDIKFIMVETPILGPTSELAAKWAMAAKEQDAYLEYHIALMQNRGPINVPALKKIAEKIKLDVAKLEETAYSPEIAAQVAMKSQKASEMGISGTPAFIIDGQLYGGYIGLDMMRKAVEEARD